MSNFLENILRSEAAGNLVKAAKKKLQDVSLSEFLSKLGIGSGKVGDLANAVINVVKLDNDAFDKKEENEEAAETEESEKTEEAQ